MSRTAAATYCRASLGLDGKGARPHTTRACCRHSSALAVALQPLQIGANICGVLVAQIAILLQRLVDDLFQFRRNFPVQLGGGTGSRFRIAS